MTPVVWILRTLSCLAAGFILLAAGRTPAASANADLAMIRVPGGEYRPFFKGKNGVAPIPVDAFLLDRRPVTRREFEAFIAREPRWRRARVQPLFAERGYLADWQGDRARAGSELAPVTNVSWFAARAYCECEGKRLPSQAEWEWAAAGGDASDPTTVRLAETTRPPHATSPGAMLRFAMGQGRVPGLAFGQVWEWTSDFNALMVANPAPDEPSNSLFCGDGFRATDASDYAGFLRFSFRSSLKANYTLKNLGFRCARDLPEDVR